MAGTTAAHVADQLRAAIEAGEFPVGETLPSAESLGERYNAHRYTVQKAVRQLAAEGYLLLTHRHPARVRERPRHLTVVRDRHVYRDDIGYFFDRNAQDWRALETPTRGVVVPPDHIADLLNLPRGQEVLARDRKMGPTTAKTAYQVATSYIPMALVAEIPALGSAKPGPGGIYDRIEEHFGAPLDWHETVSARHPTPEEQAALRIAPNSPVLVVTREARIQRGDEQLVAEVNETRMPATQFAVAYTVNRDATAAWPREEAVTP
ncbi:GntR family transcriptional regulator [Streptomyces capuensis]|uniref:GntR family transcriptional regulator n=1 Tax=Streptomyces capuensis TaxID=1464056 RepID=UPI0004BEAE35|nr:GntR family transcriptional regulator [Streptomyces capuensis]